MAGKKKETGTSPAPAERAQPVLLAGGNPQIAKGYGNAPVDAYLDAMPGWKQAVGRQIDAMVDECVPGVRKAVKWNSPLYGMGDDLWFLSFHCMTRYVKVAFFQGRLLDPEPPGRSKQAEVRYLDIHEDAPFDDTLFASWVRQASRLPGVRM